MKFDNLKLKKLDNRQLSSRIYNYLLDLILSGQIAGGEKLPINELSEYLNISNTPVREALTKLNENGLLEKVPYQGFKVKQFTYNEITDIYETRAAIEVYAVGLAARKASKLDKKKLTQIQEKGLKLIEKQDFQGYKKYNTQFHDYIIKISRNKMMYQIFRNINYKIILLASQTVDISGRPELAVQEHNDIVNYVLSGSEDKAKILMEKHLVSAMQDCLKKVRFINSSKD